MTKENVTQLMMSLNGKIPEDKAILLRQKLETVDDKIMSDIASLSLYNPTHILLFSIFLGGFGVDRFMIGDTGVGVAKLIFGWFTCGIWPLIDIFVTYKRAKEKNITKIFSIL